MKKARLWKWKIISHARNMGTALNPVLGASAASF